MTANARPSSHSETQQNSTQRQQTDVNCVAPENQNGQGVTTAQQEAAMKRYLHLVLEAGADLGGGGGCSPPSGIRPPADPKGPPFDTFSEIYFWPTDPKIFLKAPIYTNFEGERAPKKRDFLSKFFKKCPKTAFLTVFFKNLPAAQKI